MQNKSSDYNKLNNRPISKWFPSPFLHQICFENKKKGVFCYVSYKTHTSGKGKKKEIKTFVG